MKNTLKVSLVAGAIILFGAGCARNRATTPTVNLPEPSPAGQTAVVTPPEAKIEYTDQGFNPTTIRILVGTKVTFVNKSTKEMWPASGRHPTHEICPGFDAGKAYKPGESYSYTFVQSAECPMHDHLNPQMKGSIEVKAAE